MRGAAFVTALLLGAAGLACGPAPHTRAAGALSPLSVRSVAWNPNNAPLGKVRAVADAGDVVAVFADTGATIFSARAAVATDRTVTDWQGAGAITGADGSGRWIVGISGKGHLYYLRGLSAFEDVTDRYGLGGERILDAAVLGGGAVGFLLGREIAVADGTRVTRYEAGVAGITFDELVGGAGYGGALAPGVLQVFDVAHKAIVQYALPGVTHAAFGPDGRLYATTTRGLYVADAHGQLALVYDAAGDALHGLVASGSHVWFADGEELGAIDGDRVVETSGVKIARDAKLAPSSTGDVWVISGAGLDRFARAEAEPSVAAFWSTALAPVFARSCSGCHLANGEAGVDLSTAEAWESKRTKIRERVVERRSMPPQGHPLSDADREAIRAWCLPATP